MAGISRSTQFVWRGTVIAAALEAAVVDAMEETARAAEANAKERARVDTGEMRDSIEAEVTHGSDSVQLTLSVGTDHGLANELGTSRMSAQPMIRPAIDQEGARLPGRIRAHVARIR